MKNTIILVAVLVFLVIVVMAYYFLTRKEPGDLIKANATISNNGVKGEIYFDEMEDGSTHIWGKIEGLKKGLHGIHIHEKGDISKGCESMGGHYNPTSKAHGPRVINDVETDNRHIGDLGNIEANDQGVALFDFKDKHVNLSGKYSVLGRGIVVHEKADDLGMGGNDESTFSGNSGARIGCGIIALR